MSRNYLARLAPKLATVATVLFACAVAYAQMPWIVYDGFDGPGKGKHIVLISGDEEYRSEEFLPLLGKILAKHHGFKCTVLFAVNPADGTIDPNNTANIPGLENLDTADLMINSTRFRNLPDEQMEHIDRYVRAGKPIIGIRTATHAFNIPEGKSYSRYGFDSKSWDGGFGRQILGETWIAHHGNHGSQSTRAVVAPGEEQNPIVRGCGDIWGPTDVYEVRLPLPDGCHPVLLGQVLEGMQPTDKPVEGAPNNPLLPVAWTKTYQGADGRAGRVFATTMGSGKDFENEGLRRLLINASYWCLGLDEKISEKANVEIVGEYHALPFGSNKFRRNVKPSEHAIGVGK
jgi:type 1 glutamine amidotransferase